MPPREVLGVDRRAVPARRRRVAQLSEVGFPVRQRAGGQIRRAVARQRKRDEIAGNAAALIRRQGREQTSVEHLVVISTDRSIRQ
jgi:hypothetical protein